MPAPWRCVAENKLPPGVVYRSVIEQEIGEYPHVAPLPPPPLRAMPESALRQGLPRHGDLQERTGGRRRELPPLHRLPLLPGGLPLCSPHRRFRRVVHRQRPRICRARSWPEGRSQGYEARPAAEYGEKWPERGHGSPVGNARKCHFCLHRLAVGMLPACVTTCVGRATFFRRPDRPGEPRLRNDRLPPRHPLKEELGTQPAVYYLAREGGLMNEDHFQTFCSGIVGLIIGSLGMGVRLLRARYMAYGSYVPWGLWVAFDLLFLGLPPAPTSSPSSSTVSG